MILGERVALYTVKKNTTNLLGGLSNLPPVNVGRINVGKFRILIITGR